MDNLLNVSQAAFILRVHPLTIRRYIREGKLKAIKAAGNVRIKESALTDLNKEISPRLNKTSTPLSVREKQQISKVFTVNDPLFRLKGLGAHIELSK